MEKCSRTLHLKLIGASTHHNFTNIVTWCSHATRDATFTLLLGLYNQVHGHARAALRSAWLLLEEIKKKTKTPFSPVVGWYPYIPSSMWPALYNIESLAVLSYYETEILFCCFSELGNTISTLFGGGSSEPAPNVTEPVQVPAV